jgi:hypothetical protein
MQLVNGFAAQNIQCKEENTIMNGSSLETRIRRFYFTVKQGVRSINEAGSFGSKRTGFMCALFVCGTQEEALGRIIALAPLHWAGGCSHSFLHYQTQHSASPCVVSARSLNRPVYTRAPPFVFVLLAHTT